jgi:HPt (histidine-containing phosphotransfer) domain-containing protein
MDDYIAKPIELRRLEEALLRWVPRQSVAAEIGTEVTAPAAAETRVLAGVKRDQGAVPGADTPVLAVVRRAEVSAAAEYPDLDVDQLEDVTCHDPAMEQELFDLYLESTREMLASIRAAILGREVQLLRGYAHALKGGSRTIGAMALGELAEEMERLAEAADFTSAQGTLERTVAAFERVALTAAERQLRLAA